MTHKQLVVKLAGFGACLESIRWVRSHPRTTPARLWAICTRPDWMLWIFRGDQRTLVRAACDCAEMAPGHLGSPAAVECLRVTRAWCSSRATLDEVRRAADTSAAYDAADAADDDADAAAASATDAAYAIYAADTRVAAADAAYDASVAYAHSAASSGALRWRMTKAIRRRISWRMVEEALR